MDGVFLTTLPRMFLSSSSLLILSTARGISRIQAGSPNSLKQMHVFDTCLFCACNYCPRLNHVPNGDCTPNYLNFSWINLYLVTVLL